MTFGASVCRAGLNSSDCGTIYSTCSSFGNNTCMIRAANLASCSGDSGGPYYASNAAWGLHVNSNETTCPGSSNEHSWFSSATDIQTRLGVSILTS